LEAGVASSDVRKKISELEKLSASYQRKEAAALEAQWEELKEFNEWKAPNLNPNPNPQRVQ